MKIGIIGLGKMGGKIALRLLKHNHEVFVYGHHRDKIDLMVEHGGVGFDDMSKFIEEINTHETPVVWVMIPSGDITNNVLTELGEKLKKGSIVIDGGNSNYKDTINTAALLTRLVQFLKSNNFLYHKISTFLQYNFFTREFLNLIGVPVLIYLH